MIYQCYFRADQVDRLFAHEPYEAFGLEPELNPRLLERCPELEDPAIRTALCEYAAFLSLWRRDVLEDGWIGFTSYRQLEKSDVVFRSRAQVEDLLRRHDLIGWHVWSVGHLRFGGLTGAAAQAEWAHPFIHRFTVQTLADFELEIPAGYFSLDRLPFANYWAMHTTHFRQFMSWSWPIVARALELDHPFKHQQNTYDPRKAVGYFAERLFMIWMIRTSVRTRWLGAIRRSPPQK